MLEPVGPLPASVYRRRRAVALAVAVVLLGLLTWGVAAALGGGEVPVAAPAPEPAPVPRPAAFAAAEQAERARQAEGAREADGARRAEDAPGAEGQGSASPSGQAAAVLPTPSGVIGRGLLPGAVLGPLPSTAARPPAPSLPSITPAPASPSTSAATPPAGPAARAATPGAPAAPAPRCPDDAVTVLARTDKPRYAPGEKPVLTLSVRNTGPAVCSRDLDAARQAVAVVRKPGDGVWSSNDCAPGDTDDVRVLRPGEEAVFTVRWSGRTSRPGCAGVREPVPAGRYQLLARLDGIVSAPAPFVLG